MKKILILIVSLFSLVSLVFAADNNWDCFSVFSQDALLSNRNDNDAWSSTNSGMTFFIKAMPEDAMKKSFDNLRLHCCNIKKISGDICKVTNNDSVYPESIYIFDHILDVFLRRLDAKQKNDNWEDLLYNLEADEKWQEWREFITARWNEVQWSLPLEIDERFKDIWKSTQNVPSYTEFDNSNNLRKNSLETAIKSYDSRNLYDKYNLACDISNYITIFFLQSKYWLTTVEYESCKKWTNARIKNEYTYVKTLMMQKWNKLIWFNMNSYLSNYFLWNKLSEVEKTIFDISTTFAEINKAVSKLVPQCS